MPEQTADYRSILLSRVPLMDTRAPIEFAQGSFPTAINLPLMTDAERTQIGTCYKQQGQEAAIKLGHQLVQGSVKADRVAAWLNFAHKHPEGYLYCFRGGLRSQIVQQWLQEAGVDYPRISGGYKALRQFLIQTTDQAVNNHSLLVLGGMTGSGKTELLARLPNSVDLEAHAHHRGSSFGRHATAQPAQIDFENRLGVDLLHKHEQGFRQLIVEDENQTIGRCALPHSWVSSMKTAPIIWLEAPLEERINRVLKDYVTDLRQEFIATQGKINGTAAFADHLLNSLDRIIKRLGSLRHRQLKEIMQAALEQPDAETALGLHREWIQRMLQDYYDPMYHFQREKKADQIRFRGSKQEVLNYLASQG
ncbi:MAG: tRNA 2-selenouridine(34) synthase MnmH [Marinospirillum sp.]|uniref:tRNA 2-selenouridine(34) synthase MnmH n=1 Tax=Marinospirillum sp. TaxID=2183934 RepID=UPI0019EEA513|nr:tRNA 2-selenouridine(34) synthase MnmH [Marinospirillum sp.]MBE0506100.1 tRNA 2-selenouridine(34) synthase MnmH [Marinospirillum sp.]